MDETSSKTARYASDFKLSLADAKSRSNHLLKQEILTSNIIGVRPKDVLSQASLNALLIGNPKESGNLRNSSPQRNSVLTSVTKWKLRWYREPIVTATDSNYSSHQFAI